MGDLVQKKNLPGNTPVETIAISPEFLEIANCFLELQDVDKTAESLDLPRDMIVEILGRKEIRAYTNHVFMNLGFNNRFKMSKALDALIQKKFQELEEADIGSNKDITEILDLKLKFMTAMMKHEVDMAKLEQSNIKSQVNVQVNEGIGGGGNYGALIERLITGEMNRAENK